jgi:hypothetical protein
MTAKDGPVYVVPPHPVVAGLAPGSLAALEGSEEEAVAEVRAMVDAGVRYHGVEVDIQTGARPAVAGDRRPVAGMAGGSCGNQVM